MEIGATYRKRIWEVLTRHILLLKLHLHCNCWVNFANHWSFKKMYFFFLPVFVIKKGKNGSTRRWWKIFPRHSENQCKTEVNALLDCFWSRGCRWLILSPGRFRASSGEHAEARVKQLFGKSAAVKTKRGGGENTSRRTHAHTGEARCRRRLSHSKPLRLFQKRRKKTTTKQNHPPWSH